MQMLPLQIVYAFADERKYKCLKDGCGISTSRKDNLERHMRGIHPDLYPNEGTSGTEPISSEPTTVLPNMNTSVLLAQEMEEPPRPLLPIDSSALLLPETEPTRSNAVPVINSAPHSSSTMTMLQSLPPMETCTGYTTRNLHPETSPHLFISSKNLPPM
jgi:hypothetical protein